VAVTTAACLAVAVWSATAQEDTATFDPARLVAGTAEVSESAELLSTGQEWQKKKKFTGSLM
jgi:hypothetical protein